MPSPALFVARTGLSAQDTSLATISNNLANVATTGFKKDRAVFQDLLYQIQRQPGGLDAQDSQLPSGLQLGTGVRVVGTQKLFTEGNLEITDQPLDLAIDGRGFFEVLLPDGTSAFTRDGTFQINEDGDIVTSGGLELEPAINVPEDATSVTIGSDGTVTAQIDGEAAAVGLGDITLVNFVNPAGLEAIGNNLFLETEASGDPQEGTPGEDGIGSLVQGALETSNVEVVEELVNLITSQRAFEVNSRVVSTVDQMFQFLSNNL